MKFFAQKYIMQFIGGCSAYSISSDYTLSTYPTCKRIIGLKLSAAIVEKCTKRKEKKTAR